MASSRGLHFDPSLTFTISSNSYSNAAVELLDNTNMAFTAFYMSSIMNSRFMMAIRDAFVGVFNKYHSITTTYDSNTVDNIQDQKPSRPATPKFHEKVKSPERRLSTVTPLYNPSDDEVSSLKQEVGSLRDENVKLRHELESIKSAMFTRDQSFKRILESLSSGSETTIAIIRKDIEILEAQHSRKAMEIEHTCTQMVSKAMESIYKHAITAKQLSHAIESVRRDVITPKRIKELIHKEVGTYFQDSLSSLEEGTLHELFREKRKRSRGKKKNGKKPSETNLSGDDCDGSEPEQK